MTDNSEQWRRTVAGAVLLAAGLLLLLRLAGPIRLVAILLIGAGAFALNKVDPKRLTAVLVVIAAGSAWLAYRTWQR